MSHLESGLGALAEAYGLDAQALLVEAHRAPYARTPWPQGTGRPGERAVLYALVRVLQPDLVVECGTNWGCSTTQFLSAVRENKKGRVVSIDIRSRTEGRPIGARIPPGLKNRWQFQRADAAEWLEKDSTPLTFVFEDTDHTVDTTRRICEAAARRLAPGGWLVVHDVVIPAVKEGIRQAGVDAPAFLFDDSGRGLAIWRKPVVDPMLEWAVTTESEGTPLPEFDATVEREAGPDYNRMSNSELRAEIEQRGLAAPAKANKAKLVEILTKGGLDA